MSTIDQILEIGGSVLFLIIGTWATVYAYGLVGGRLVGGFRWRPEFQRSLRWLGPLLVVLCVGSLVFLFR